MIPRKIIDVRVLTAIINVHSGKTGEKIAKTKFAIMIKPESHVQKCVRTYNFTKFDGFNIKNEPRNDHIVRLIKWSVMGISNQAEPPQSNSSEK